MDSADKESLHQLLSSLDMCLALGRLFLELGGSPGLTRDIMRLLL